MNERGLLERAARAAGYVRMEYRDDTPYVSLDMNGDSFIAWNPLTDDGDALRLAVKLGLEIDLIPPRIAIRTRNGTKVLQNIASDPYAATRLAIVRAAAALAGDGSER